MSTQPIDYDSLAAQHGGTAAVDYDALAAQHGGVASAPEKAPDERSFLEKAATQPSQFSHANPLRYLDELGQGMAQGAQMLAHPIDTARKIYKTATTPIDHDPAGDVPLSEGLGNVADTLAQGYGQTATMAGASKAISASKGLALGAAKRGVLLGRTPEAAYESALKPSTTLSEGQRAKLVQTGLQEGIPVSKAGLATISEKISDLADSVSQKIQAGAGRGVTVDPFKVAGRLADTADSFRTQVNPEADINAVANAGNEFLRNNKSPYPSRCSTGNEARHLPPVRKEGLRRSGDSISRSPESACSWNQRRTGGTNPRNRAIERSRRPLARFAADTGARSGPHWQPSTPRNRHTDYCGSGEGCHWQL
jgi:hypothetical protein